MYFHAYYLHALPSINIALGLCLLLQNLLPGLGLGGSPVLWSIDDVRR